MLSPNMQSRWTIVVLAIVSMPSTLFAQSPSVVDAYAQHSGSNIVYFHRITNLSNRNVTAIAIGYDTDYSSPNKAYSYAKPELAVFPAGSHWGQPSQIGDQAGFALREGGTFSGPSGWKSVITSVEHSPGRMDTGHYIKWHSDASISPGLQPSQTLTLSVTVPTKEEAYLSGHFVVHYSDGNEPWAYTGIIRKLDTMPPVLSLTVSPTHLQVTAGKLVTVTATITATDDYDPQPEIRLESITANEPLAAGDVSGAAFGTDDRQFQLRDVKVPKGSAGRIYTITYSATDASGNKATASATVAVK